MKALKTILAAFCLIAAHLPLSAQKTIFSDLDDKPGIERVYISSPMIMKGSKYTSGSITPKQARSMNYIETVSASRPDACQLINSELEKFLKANPDLELILSDSSAGEKTKIYVRYNPEGTKYTLTIIYSEDRSEVSVTVINGERDIDIVLRQSPPGRGCFTSSHGCTL